MGEFVIHIDQDSGAITVKDEAGKDIPAVGNLFSEDPKKTYGYRKAQDEFEEMPERRLIKIPLELWEKKGNTICKIKIGGTVFEKPC